MIDVRLSVRRDHKDPVAAAYRARRMLRHEPSADGFFAQVPVRATRACAKVVTIVLGQTTLPLPEFVATKGVLEDVEEGGHRVAGKVASRSLVRDGVPPHTERRHRTILVDARPRPCLAHRGGVTLIVTVDNLLLV